MLVLIGASASGKTEIAKRLIAHHNFKKTVTYTTRPKRSGEVDGVDYHFLGRDEFITKMKIGFFLETSEYSGNLYGTAFKDASLDKVLIVDIRGANALYEALKDDVMIFFIETPVAIRRERMQARGDFKEDIEQRLTIDQAYFKVEALVHVDKIIVNERHDLKALTQSVYDAYVKTMHV